MVKPNEFSDSDDDPQAIIPQLGDILADRCRESFWMEVALSYIRSGVLPLEAVKRADYFLALYDERRVTREKTVFGKVTGEV